MKTKPFSAIRPASEIVSKLACVPYDVVDSAEAKALVADNDVSFLHVSRPEVDLPDGIDIYSPEVYDQAAKALSGFIDKGALEKDPVPAYYLYRQIMGDHSQTGIVACFHIDDYVNDVIRKHEKTRQDKEDDRTRHVLRSNANTGPVFLTYRDEKAIDDIVDGVKETAPLYDFTADDSIRHTVWKVPGDGSDLRALFDKVPIAYIADGHHRAKAACRAGLERRAANPAHTGDEEYNWFLAVIFPASQLRILPYNRCVQDLNGLTSEEFLAKVSEIFEVVKTDDPVPAGERHANMYLGGCWYALSWPPFEADPVASLDVSVLQERLLAPVLGIEDPRTNKRISFVGGIRGTAELERRVDSGRDTVAFSMAPVTVEQMMAIADAGQIMPPKSTWFEPKLRSGLFVHEII